MSQEPPSKDERNAATGIALVGVLICAGALTGLVALVFPRILWFVAVIAVMGIIGVIQYAVWGWKLDKYRIKDDE